MQEHEEKAIRERLDALARTLAELHGRVEALEGRLEGMERKAAPPPPPWPAPPPAPIARESAPAEPLAEPTHPVQEGPRPGDAGTATGASLESSLGLVWLNRAGVLTLVLGVAFLFKYAVDNEWIGPRGRVALGAAAGLGALAAGEALWRRGQRIFSMGILALGVCVLHASAYAAHGFYGFAPAPASFAAMAMITAAGAWLALRHDAQPVIVLSILGGFAAPLALETGRDAPWVLFPYLLLLDAGAAWTCLRRGWRAAPVTAAAASVLVFAWWLGARFEPAARAPALLFVLGVYGVFLPTPLPVLRGILQVFAGLSLAGIWREEAGSLLAFLLPLAAAGLWRAGAAAAWAGFWMPWWLAVFGSEATFALRFWGSAAGFGLISGWLSGRCRNAAPHGLPGELAVLSANALAFAATGYVALDRVHGAWTGPFLFAMALLHAAAAWLLRRREEAARLKSLLAAVFLTLAIPAQFGGWRVGIAWATEAALLAWLARRWQSGWLDWISGAVLGIALGRVAVADAPGVRGHLLVNARFFTMLWTALACWACAALYRSRSASALSWVAGHVTLWAALELEALAQVWRTAPPESARSAAIVAFSVVLAVYGVALIALGIARRAPLDRAAGLAALLLVAAKLYLYDVWQLGRLFRTTAFVSLGVLLVAASFLYSRHRERAGRRPQPGS
ncbi:MAG: DUF2339 domain-containing protein [Bryobacteraceae bacterium]|nr:DUF2339 domain-containing protein [Bryobacteraceae bacterium]